MTRWAVFDPFAVREGEHEEQVERYYETVFCEQHDASMGDYTTLATDEKAEVCEAYIAHMCKLLGVEDYLAKRLKEQSAAAVDEVKVVAFEKDADEEDALRVLQAAEHPNGRGPFEWLTFANGDVCLAVWPQGALFEELLQKGAFT